MAGSGSRSLDDDDGELRFIVRIYENLEGGRALRYDGLEVLRS